MASSMARRRKVVVMPEGALPMSSAPSGRMPLAIHWLRDATGARRLFAFSLGTNDELLVMEAQRMTSEAPSSFFVNNVVVRDGCPLLLTPVDPLFLALPLLDRCADRLVPGSQLADAVPEGWGPAGAWRRLLAHCRSAGLLDRLCDVDDRLGPSMRLYRLSREKTTSWLRRKQAAAEDALRHDAETKAELERGLLEARFGGGAGAGGAFRVASGRQETGAAPAAALTSAAEPSAASASAGSCSTPGGGAAEGPSPTAGSPATPHGQSLSPAAGSTPATAAAASSAAAAAPDARRAGPAVTWDAASARAAAAVGKAVPPTRALRVEAARLVGRYLSDEWLQRLCEAAPEAGAGAALDWRYVAGITAQDKGAVRGGAIRGSAGGASGKAPVAAGRAKPGAYRPAVAVGVADVSRFVGARPSPPPGGEDARGGKRRAPSAGRAAKKLKGVDTSGMRSLASMFGRPKPKRK